jgi:hypothetical protein
MHGSGQTAFLFANRRPGDLLGAMGFFDRSNEKKPAPLPAGDPVAPSAGGVMPQLAAAREKLEAGDLPGALVIYEQVLADAGDRADVLVAISGDLGSNGHVQPIIELIAPRYDAQRHGPATGLNVLQAYLTAHDADAAQHVLDILFSLNRPELEERLYGFSNAIAELIAQGVLPDQPPTGEEGVVMATEVKVSLITISRPVWFYGLEPLASEILPPKEGRLRRVAFAQLALPGLKNIPEAMAQPEDELGRLSRALPLWLAETFYFSPHYAPLAVVGVMDHPETGKKPMLFGAEWTTDNLHQLANTCGEKLDYVFTGALQHSAGEYELLLRVWDMKKFRERKAFVLKWTSATADAELTKLHEAIRAFMEWEPEKRGLAYAPPAKPGAWLDALGASLGFFLLEKVLQPKALVTAPDFLAAGTAQLAASSEVAALASLTLHSRATRLGLTAPGGGVKPFSTPLVEHAQQTLAFLDSQKI